MIESIPVLYSDTRKLARPHGPCESMACATDIKHSGRYTYDHCHTHGWVRGVLCYSCNNRMKAVDEAMTKQAYSELAKLRGKPGDHGKLFRHWMRCPDCAASFTTIDIATIIDLCRVQYSRAYFLQLHVRELKYLSTVERIARVFIHPIRSMVWKFSPFS